MASLFKRTQAYMQKRAALFKAAPAFLIPGMLSGQPCPDIPKTALMTEATLECFFFLLCLLDLFIMAHNVVCDSARPQQGDNKIGSILYGIGTDIKGAK